MIAVGVGPDAEHLLPELAGSCADADREHTDSGVVDLARHRYGQFSVFRRRAVRYHDGDVRHVQTIAGGRSEYPIPHRRQSSRRVRSGALQVRDVTYGVRYLLLRPVLVEVENEVDVDAEYYSCYGDAILRHVQVLNDLNDERLRPLEVSHPHAARGVDQKRDVCYSSAR